MPIAAAWDSTLETWTLEIDGHFTLDEVAEVVDKSSWAGASRFVWDLRDARRGPSTTEELRELVGLIAPGSEQWAGSRIAVVVDRDFSFGISRMFQAHAESLEFAFEIFRDLDTARAWVASEGTPSR